MPQRRVAEHGTRSAYVAGCTAGVRGTSCAACREANRLYQLAWRRSRGVLPLPAEKQRRRSKGCGTAGAYARGCRCLLCRAANTQKQREWRAKQKERITNAGGSSA